MKKIILTLTFLISSLFSQECADEFSPDKFGESPEFLNELIETNFNDIGFFGTKKEYEKLGYISKKGEFFKPDSYTTYRDYTYPSVNGLWSYKLNEKGNVDIVNIAQVELRKLDSLDLGETLSSDFDGAWRKWDGDSYEHYMIPEFVRFKYKDKYISIKVYFWGTIGDSARVDNSVINYQLIDFTDEVNGYTRCVLKHK